MDLDVHHGDGVEAIFWNDPNVLTLSLHETGLSLFPGTGFVDDRGGPEAHGTAVNVPLEPGTADASWLAALEMLLAPLAVLHAEIERSRRIASTRSSGGASLSMKPLAPARRAS